MRVRVRGPKGASTLTLQDEATVADLIEGISTLTGISKLDVKYGYPPKPLNLKQLETTLPLSKLEVKLDGEQLTVCSSTAVTTERANAIINPTQQKTNLQTNKKSNFSTPAESTTHRSLNDSLSTERERKDEVPVILMPSREASVVLRVMPDDNSCLFRAVGAAVLPGDARSMHELRSLVASVIQTERETYTKAVLEKSIDDYCRWIQTPEAWGGAIELGILAKHFDIEICSIDVQSLRIDRYNEGQNTRCILVYSGIHYDTVALSPLNPYHHSGHNLPELDQRVWDSHDNEVLDAALELCRILQAKHYYTDTGAMRIKCNNCGTFLHGQQQASKHAEESGHYDMSEVS